jgi:serine/threonine protein kinase
VYVTADSRLDRRLSAVLESGATQVCRRLTPAKEHMTTLPSSCTAQDTCLSEDVVLAFQCGETTESERQRIHQHIDRCDVCRKVLVTTAALDGGESMLGVELDSMERLAAVIGSGLRTTRFTEGKRLAHRFDVTRFVDRGGMGEVYEAFDRVVGARVALKALLQTTAQDDPGVSRLGDEVKLARRIAHPNVCRIHDLHEHREAGHVPLRFLAMEFVDGFTLKERLLAGEMPVEEACSIARQLLMGLAAVHAAGVLHLDIKSQNVMLRHGTSQAQAVVMDFSLSRAFEKELRLRTSERRAAGSVGYMSPEQLECQSTIGPAADVYAFGVVFYEMLTGQMPFQGDSPAAVMLKQLKSRAVPPSRSRPAVSPQLDEFVLSCLSRHARSRFQSAASAIEALDRCVRPVPRERRWNGGSWQRTLGIATGAAALAGMMVHLAGRLTGAEASTAETLAPAPPAASLPSPTPESDSTPPRSTAQPPTTELSAAPSPSGASTLDRPAEQRPLPFPGAAVDDSRRASAAADRGAVAPSAGLVQRQRSVDGGPKGTALTTPPASSMRAGAETVPSGAAAQRGAARALDGAPSPEPDAKRPKEEWIPQRAPDFLL